MFYWHCRMSYRHVGRSWLMAGEAVKVGFRGHVHHCEEKSTSRATRANVVVVTFGTSPRFLQKRVRSLSRVVRPTSSHFSVTRANPNLPRPPFCTLRLRRGPMGGEGVYADLWFLQPRVRSLEVQCMMFYALIIHVVSTADAWTSSLLHDIQLARPSHNIPSVWEAMNSKHRIAALVLDTNSSRQRCVLCTSHLRCK